MEYVYLIRDNGTGLHKIGMTSNWERRKKELRVGSVTTPIKIVQCKDAKKWERVLHAMFKHKRLPQSEWFRIEAKDAIPKMEWLANQSSQSIVIGNWKQAKDGHWYRRRKSGSGNWYTEQQDAQNMRRLIDQQLETTVGQAEKEWLNKSRNEPGFWPAKEDKTRIEWQEKDPTAPGSGCSPVLIAIIAFFAGMVYMTGTSQRESEPSPPSPPEASSVLPESPEAPPIQPFINTLDDVMPDAEPEKHEERVPESALAPNSSNQVDAPSKEQQLDSPQCSIHSYRESNAKQFDCSISRRVNSNGHTVYDVAWSDGNSSSYIFWVDGRVEILYKRPSMDSNVHLGFYEMLADGVEIKSNEGSITLIPGLEPQAN